MPELRPSKTREVHWAARSKNEACHHKNAAQGADSAMALESPAAHDYVVVRDFFRQHQKGTCNKGQLLQRARKVIQFLWGLGLGR